MHRRNVQIHASSVLATSFLLVGPVLGRLMPGFVPGLTIRSIEDFPRFAYAIHLSNLIIVAIALLAYIRHPRGRKPMLWISGVVVLQSILFETLGRSDARRETFNMLAASSPMMQALVGLLIGLIAVYLGWTRPTVSGNWFSGVGYGVLCPMRDVGLKVRLAAHVNHAHCHTE